MWKLLSMATVLPTGTGSHFLFSSPSPACYPFTISVARCCSCYVIIPPQLLRGRKSERAHSSKAPPSPPEAHAHTFLPYSPSSLPPLSSRKLHCSMQTATSFPRHHRNAESAALQEGKARQEVKSSGELMVGRV